MSLIPVPDLPEWVPVIGGDPSGGLPAGIDTGLPEALTGFQNKYTPNNDPDSFYNRVRSIPNLEPRTLRTLLGYDAERVARRGQRPVPTRQSLAALKAAQTNQAQTPQPRKGFFDRAVGDLRSIVGAIPHMLNPNLEKNLLAQEFYALENLPQAISEARGDPGKILQAPGIRLIPGAYTAGNILSGKAGELWEHPLYTAMDVAPFAKPAIKAAVPRVAANPTVQRIAQATAPAREAVRASGPGQMAVELFGLRPTSRSSRSIADMAELEAKLSTKVRQMIGSENVTNHPIGRIAKEVDNLHNSFPIDTARRSELGHVIEQDWNEVIRQHTAGNISDIELAYATKVRDLSDAFESQVLGLLDENGNPRYLQHDPVLGEVFNPAQMGRLNRARTAEANYADGLELSQAIANPQAAIGTAFTYFGDKLPDMSRTQAIRQGANIMHAMDMVGYDVTALRKTLKQARKGGANVKAIADDIRVAYQNGIQSTIYDLPPAEVAARIPMRANDLSTVRFYDRLKRGDYAGAAEILRGIDRRTGPAAINTIDDTLKEYVRRKVKQTQYGRYIKDVDGKPYSPEGLARHSAITQEVTARIAPARFDPAIEAETRSRFAQYLRDRSAQMAPGDVINPTSLATALDDLDRGAYANIPGWEREVILDDGTVIKPALEEMRKLGKEVEKTWQTMKASGIDPVFLHRVPNYAVSQLNQPRILEAIRTPTQVRERTGDITPYIHDPNIALSHQGMELLAREASEEFVAQVYTMFGEKRADLERLYEPQAQRLAERDPRKDFRTHLDDIIKKRYNTFDPTGIVTWKSPRLGSLNYDQVWIPKAVERTLQRMHTPASSRLTAAIDPVLKVFRTSLLAASPRWHLYNIIGGGMMLTARTDPIAILRYMGQARQMLKPGGMTDDLAREIGLQQGMGTVGAEVVDWNRAGRFSFGFKSGSQARQWFDQAGGVVGKGIEKSYQLNQMVDDMYRTIAYLYGNDKALTKGLTKVQAQEAGIALSRKVLQNWDRMTPMARTVMRYMFPFYGWISHLMRYTTTFPWDHPVRVAVMGTFARNEMADFGTGLPQRLLNTLFLGEPDEDGNVSALNVGGMNPFSDVANYATTLGFLFGGEADFSRLVSDLNPLVGAGLQAIGIDPITGTSGLFPEVRYDPESGRLTPISRNPLTILAGNVVPQSRLLMGMLNSRSEYQELLRTNPEAAQRLMMSQLGLPILFRDINPEEEIMRAEVARDDAMRQAISEAMTTGRWDALLARYPNLEPLYQALLQAEQAGQLEQYQTIPSGIDSRQAFQGGIVQNFNPLQ